MNIFQMSHSFACHDHTTEDTEDGENSKVSAIIVLRETREEENITRYYYSCSRGHFCFCKDCRYARGSKHELKKET